MPSNTVDASPLDIVRQKLAENDGFWERAKSQIVHDPTLSPVEKATLISAGVWYFGKLLNVL